MPSLLAAIQGLDPFLRAHVSGISIHTAGNGYRAVLSINHFGPVGRELKRGVESEFPGVAMQGVSRHPDVELLLDWQIPIWDQILQLVHDPYLSVPDELGAMEAAELSRAEPDGTVSRREALRTWIVKTHLKDRAAWVARCMTYSADIGTPAE